MVVPSVVVSLTPREVNAGLKTTLLHRLYNSVTMYASMIDRTGAGFNRLTPVLASIDCLGRAGAS